MRTFSYEIRPIPGGPTETGDLEAEDERDAHRLLRVRYCRARLPEGTKIFDKASVEEAAGRERSARLRRLLKALTDHHTWLQNPDQGARADLRGNNLSGLPLKGAKLSHAILAQADLENADLSGADLTYVDLTGSNLRGADLTGADLSRADLSDADLRNSVLREAVFASTDVWRANFQGAVVDPATLHLALRCKEPE